MLQESSGPTPGISLSSVAAVNIDVENSGLAMGQASQQRKSINENHESHAYKRPSSVNTTKSWRNSTFGPIAKWYSTPPEHTGTPKASVTFGQKARTAFIRAVTDHQELPFHELVDACNWFCDYLETQIKHAWVPLIQPQLSDVNQLGKTPSPEDIGTAFKFLTSVVSRLKAGDANVALTDICDPLFQNLMLKETGSSRARTSHLYTVTELTYQGRGEGLQLVFAAVGWITCLYAPEKPPLEIDHFAIAHTASPLSTSHIPGRTIIRHKQHHKYSEISTKCSVEDHYDQPLKRLLARFDCTFPDPLETHKISHKREDADVWIEGALLNFHMLNKIAQIDIEWVETLGEHLKFDVRQRKLKIFKYPSLCLVFLINPKVTNNWLRVSEATEPSNYYHEILLSYRLIFGSSPRSCTLFTQLAPTWSDAFFGSTSSTTIDSPDTSSSTSKSPIPRFTPRFFHSAPPEPPILPLDAIPSPPSKPPPTFDPLLLLLCASPCNAQGPASIYNLIEAPPLAPNYNANIHFPFLGKRLSDIQEYARARKPGGFTGLWHDSRDAGSWWTLWPVLIFGAIALIIGVIQVVLQAVQIDLSRQQLNLARQELFEKL